MDPENREHPLSRLSQRLYQRLLLAYPRAHRAEYGSSMIQLFRDQCRDAWRDAGGRGIVMLWLRVFPDLLKSSFLEHLTHLKDKRFMGGTVLTCLRSPSAPRNAFVVVFSIVFGLWFTTSALRTHLLAETFAHFGDVSRIRIQRDSADLSSSSIYDPYVRQTKRATDVAKELLDKKIAEDKLRMPANRRVLQRRIIFRSAHNINRMDGDIEIRQAVNGSVEVEPIVYEDMDYRPSRQSFYLTLLGCTSVACIMGLLAGGLAAFLVSPYRNFLAKTLPPGPVA